MGENAGVSNPYAPPQQPSPPTDGDRRPVVPPQPPQHLVRPPQGPPRAPVPPGGARPPRPQRPVDEAGVARARRLARTFAVLVLGGVLTGMFPVPWSGVSFAFAIAAIVVGVRAFVVAVRAHARGSLPVLLGVATATALGWLVVSLATILLWPAQIEHQDCLAGALTQTARQQCDVEFEQGVKDMQQRIEDRARG